MTGARSRAVLAPESRPRFARHARLRHDPARDRWVLLVPERVLVPDETAVEVLRLCDGERSIEAIVAELAQRYDAEPALIRSDCLGLLQDLADKGFVIAAAEGGS